MSTLSQDTSIIWQDLGGVGTAPTVPDVLTLLPAA